jgi:hypothetical protein
MTCQNPEGSKWKLLASAKGKIGSSLLVGCEEVLKRVRVLLVYFFSSVSSDSLLASVEEPVSLSLQAYN